jgi:hypothetical protein
MFKKIWSDPVWSKVISAIIIAGGSFLISIIYSLNTELNLKQSSAFLWNHQIKLGPTIVVIICGLLILALIQSITQKSPSKREKLESKFHQKFRKIEDSVDPITYRFNAYISSYTNFPFISELRVYCTAHNDGEKLMSSHSGCPNPNCSKYRISFDQNYLKTHIETSLLKEWEIMNI